MLVDSHCHLDFPELAGRIDQVLESMRDAGVGAALCIGVSMEGLPKVLALAERHANLFASVGVHPEHQDCLEPDAATLARHARHPRVVGIGETGLDYYWHKDKPEWQRERFRTHVRAARESGKPLIIHTREAAEDTLRILREEGAEAVGGVMHCFTESQDVADKALELGFFISFSGIVTFKNARQLKEVAKRVPLDRLLVETDSPYLAPAPHRGKVNEPAYVRHVASEIATLKGIGIEEVEKATTTNFCRLFKISTESTGFMP
ncbi:MAG: TatD family hydrolase [Zoogloeaceae bacterium]|jgi:TatD DNase family protein|nr:TatD family hydrolase [Zoogloeaceae bacterium]